MLRFGQSFHPTPPVLRLSLRLALLALGGGVFLSGCGFLRFEQREAWRAEAELACMRAGIVRETPYIHPTKPIDGPGPCGTDLPLKVAAFEIDPAILSSYAAMPQAGGSGSGLTAIKPEATMGCPMVAWTDDWVNGAVQPAAKAWFGQNVVEIRTAGSYACRRRNHNPSAKLSEHAFGNAIDVISFVFADGYIVTVKGGWKGTGQEQSFLRDVLYGACERFKTVLGPGSNALHYDHFHLDLARHDARGTRRYCNPKVAAPARPQPGERLAPVFQAQRPLGGPLTSPGFATPVPPVQARLAPGRSLGQTGETQPLEQEEDFNPRDFDITSSTLDLPAPRYRDAVAQPMPEPTTRLSPIPGNDQEETSPFLKPTP